MASQQTTFCLVNESGMDIVNTSVSEVDNYDWDGQSRPDKNFAGCRISNNNSRCQREEINTHAKSSPFKLTLTFSDGTDLTFRTDQRDSYTKHNRLFDCTGSATDRLQLYQTSGGYTNAFYVQTRAVPDNTGWMGGLLARHPNILINGLTMPGSHDAGMYTIGSSTAFASDSWVLTQSLSIFDQLKAGSRYFDFRVYEKSGTLYLAHYSGDSAFAQGGFGPTLEQVMLQIQQFMALPGAASEAVFLKFSHTYSSGAGALSSIVNKVQNGLGAYLYKSSDANLVLQKQPLANLKGHVVATFDTEFAAYWNNATGVFKYIDIPNPPTTTVNGHTTPVVSPTATGLQVFDHYADSDEYTTMVDDQTGLLGSYGGYGKDYLFLMSWTLTGKTGLLDVQVLSTLCNPWLPQYTTLWRSQSPKPNIVFIDFVTPWLCNGIIAVNG